jgi:hypothetical protein
MHKRQLTYQAGLLQSNTVNTSIPPENNDITLRTRQLKTYNLTVSRRPVFNINAPSPNITYQPTPVAGVESALSPVDNNIDGVQPAKYVPANTQQRPLSRENVTVIFTQRDGDYATSTTFTRSTGEQPIELFPGDYNVQAFAQYNLDAPIQTKPEEICVDGGFWGGDECQTIPGQSIPSGQEGAVRQCVAEQSTEAELETFLAAVNSSEATPLDVAENRGYNVEQCVEDELAYRDNTITTGGFTDANHTLTIPEDANTITTPYFAYNPDQINTTRDMMVMSSVLQLAGQTKDFPALQPSVS